MYKHVTSFQFHNRIAHKTALHMLQESSLDAGGDPAAAQAAFTTAIQAYEKALQIPERLGKLQDRCNARYNAACALALGGQQTAAKQLLEQLLGLSLISAADIAADSDLQSIQSLVWTG